MSYLPAATRCVSDGVNNISLTDCKYNWAVLFLIKSKISQARSKRGGGGTVSKISIHYQKYVFIFYTACFSLTKQIFLLFELTKFSLVISDIM